MASRRLDISSLLCDDSQPAFSPLEALVQAATEERKRLGVDEQPPHHHHHHHLRPSSSTGPPPIDDRHMIRSPVSPHLARHPFDDHQRTLVQQPYLHRPRPHHDNLILQEQQQQQQQQQHHRQRSHEFDPRAFEADRRRRIQEAEQQQQQQQRRMQELEYQRQRELQQAQAQELDRRRREDERQRAAIEYERLQRERDERREAEHLLQQQREYQRVLLEEQRRERERQLERAREAERQREAAAAERQQREVAERQRDMDRLHRQHEHRSPVTPSISHLISHPHTSTPIALDPLIPDDHRPVKKRRFSESPTRPIPDDKERLAREREKMLVGELGYGRVDSPVAGPSSASRRPGSGHGQVRKVVAVADLLERAPIARPESRDAPHVLSPLGRRSPPGSQVGRAKAARKSDEFLSLSSRELQEPKPKQERKPSQSRQNSDETIRSPATDEPRPKKLKESTPAPLKPTSKPSQDDVHEFFLHQYDEEPSPTTSSRPGPPHTPSPSISPVTSTILAPLSAKSPPASHKTLTAVVALEKELESLVSTPPPTTTITSVVVKKQEPDDMDLDVDLAVKELVETMESDDVKHVGMEVDVEDELLSLLDDRPSRPARRALGTTAPTSHASATPAQSAPVVNTKHQGPPPVRATSEVSHPSPPAMSGALLSIPTAARHSSTRPASERGSMPPPASTSKAGAVKKGAERAASVVASPAAESSTSAAGGKKKKETTAKASNAKSKAASSTASTSAAPTSKPKAKSKAAAKKTVEASSGATLLVPSKPAKATAGKKAPAPSVSRSRSTSVMPAGNVSVGPESDAVKAEKQEEEEDSDAANDDDKLYCVCKTRYDEDRFMIACDRCDEWYHTQCVNMPDLEVDLVDQFICPPCVEKNPHLNLRTTYKQRCLYGLRHPDPTSTKACHKAARGAFSKYCSDECGIKYMQTRIDSYAKKGGKTEKLWESVKHAEKREGVVVCAVDPSPPHEANGCTKMEVDVKQEDIKPVKPKLIQPTKTKVERETERLTGLLDAIVKMREEIKRGMEVVVWRERLLQLASERAEQVGQCGWDQRLCCDDEEWADIGAGVLESYDETKVDGVKEESGEGEMDVDVADEQWWCPGKKVCDRHAGWQTVRYKDVCKEKEKKEEALTKLTTRERELRKNIEDMLEPQNDSTTTTKAKDNAVSHAPLKSSNAKQVNGHPKSKTSTANTEKKGKKRKAPS